MENEGITKSAILLISLGEDEAALATLGFHQKKPGTHTKQDFSVTWGAETGSADIDLKAVGRHGTVQYCHQYMLPNTTVWVDWPATLDSRLPATITASIVPKPTRRAKK